MNNTHFMDGVLMNSVRCDVTECLSIYLLHRTGDVWTADHTASASLSSRDSELCFMAGNTRTIH